MAENALVRVFNNSEFGSVRTVTIDDEPWFVGKDVCSVFGDTNHKRSLSRIDDEDKMLRSVETNGGIQNVTVINESGLYALLFCMQPAKAKGVLQNDSLVDERIDMVHRFKRWVTSEVIPSIRKHGAYMTPDVLKECLCNPRAVAELLTKLADTEDARGCQIEHLAAENYGLDIIHEVQCG